MSERACVYVSRRVKVRVDDCLHSVIFLPWTRHCNIKIYSNWNTILSNCIGLYVAYV